MGGGGRRQFRMQVLRSPMCLLFWFLHGLLLHGLFLASFVYLRAFASLRLRVLHLRSLRLLALRLVALRLRVSRRAGRGLVGARNCRFSGDVAWRRGVETWRGDMVCGVETWNGDVGGCGVVCRDVAFLRGVPAFRRSVAFCLCWLARWWAQFWVVAFRGVPIGRWSGSCLLMWRSVAFRNAVQECLAFRRSRRA